MQRAICFSVAMLMAVTATVEANTNNTAEVAVAAPLGTFPTLKASNLENQKFTLPRDFAGERNLLLIAFKREQQKNVDTWLRGMKRFSTSSDFRYYELPTIGKLNPIARWFINHGMRNGIPDRKARARTITLYVDKAAFKKALNLSDENHIYAILVDRAGRVYWRAEGDFDKAKADSLKQALSVSK